MDNHSSPCVDLANAGATRAKASCCSKNASNNAPVCQLPALPETGSSVPSVWIKAASRIQNLAFTATGRC